MANSGRKNWVFHNETITASNGFELIVENDYVTVNIYITGDATSSTLIFEGKDNFDNWYPIQCVNLSTLDIASQTTTSGTNQVWQCDLTGLVKFRVRISSITVTEGQSISVYGRVVD